MAEFFVELKRRHIYRVAAAYAVVAWLLLQLINNLTPALRLPDWVATLVVVLLVSGFPIALLFCWIQHLPSAEGSAPLAKTAKLDWVLVGALAAVLLFMGYQQVAPPRQAGVEVARSASLNPGAAISLAVLPFTNLSDDRDQEFFSDGMTEEITSALAKIPDLRVVGRTSAFQFKGQNQDLRAIGQALSATHLLEGSVRKEGNRLRITAQLIVADNGVHVWTESYNRELTGVFAVQEEIATAIAGALRMPLGLRQGEQLVSSRTDNLESYDRFLRAKAEYRARGTTPAVRAVLETLVAGDPDFAPAWGLLAQAYVISADLDQKVMSRSIDETRRLRQFNLDKGEKAAREAIRLDSRHASGFMVLGRIEAYNYRWAASEDLIRQAMALDPNDPEIVSAHAVTYAISGRLRESLPLMQQARALDPLASVYNIYLAQILLSSGQTEAAISVLEAIPNSQPGFRNEMLARAHAAAGRFSMAGDRVLAIPRDRYGDMGQSIDDAIRLLRDAPTKAGAPDSLPVLPSRLNFIYAYVGAPDRMMDYPERALEAGMAQSVGFLFSPIYASVRKTERFKAFVRNAGMVDHWRARGWPDLCRPMGADDFVCD